MDQLRLGLGPTPQTQTQTLNPPNGIPIPIPNPIPEELRCKRSDGKQWRCSALSMPDKTVCEKHYVQAKKRAANSALRASLKKAKRTAQIDPDPQLHGNSHKRTAQIDPDPQPHGNSHKRTAQIDPDPQPHGDSHKRTAEIDREPEPQGSLFKRTAEIDREPEGNVHKRVRGNGFADFRAGRPVRLDGVNLEGYNGNFVEPKGFSGNGVVRPVECFGNCHQCGKSCSVSWCESCEKRGYCANCISKWYDEIPMDQIRKICPACRGICNCQVCLQGDNLIKAKVQEMNGMEKLKNLHRLLVYVLPVVKQIYSDQCFEIGVEARALGSKVEIPRAKINPDQQMLCDFCEVPIFDYHRHCLTCSYDLCLSCCTDIRDSSKNEISKEKENNNNNSNNNNDIDINNSLNFSDWKSDTVGMVPCRPHASGGCGASELVLRRLLKIHWISKLMKNTEEMVHSCRVQKELEVSSGAPDQDKASLYCPSLEDLRRDGISRFSESWDLGIPVLVKQAFEIPLSYSWDPFVVLRGVKDSMEGEMEGKLIVKGFDCGNRSEVEVELNKFIKGYSESQVQEQGTAPVLTRVEWPSPAVLEEFLTNQRPEFLTNFPLIEFIHSKWGVLNLVSKLPHDASFPEMGPNLVISHGNGVNEGNYFGGDLRVNMCDVVYMLMHMAERKENNEKCNGSEISPNCSKLERESSVGAIWDVFRREDVPKLNEFLRSRQNKLVKYPVYDGSVFLNEEAKNVLKNEFGVEPWTIRQNIGDAIFIPAGCPFQFTNIQSSVQLKFEFLFPESISESVRMAQEIRSLPNGHLAKLNIMEVRKMCLYAASSAIREIQKISLDPKLELENKFEDHNLTEAVSENLARVSNKQMHDN